MPGPRGCTRTSRKRMCSTTRIPTPSGTRAPPSGKAAARVTSQPDQPGGQGEMRAAVISRHGEPPRYAYRPVPRRAPGQALIRVQAAPVNPLDLLCASGTSYFGSRVWFSCDAGMAPGDGAMAQWCLAAETAVVALPDGIADDLAAALGLSAIAAWMALTWRGGLQPGEHVLVLGASGTVGQVGVQAARLLDRKSTRLNSSHP